MILAVLNTVRTPIVMKSCLFQNIVDPSGYFDSHVPKLRLEAEWALLTGFWASPWLYNALTLTEAAYK
jgi:hypothetical protein